MEYYKDVECDIKNTFAPISNNEFLSVPIILRMLNMKIIKKEELPADVKKRVESELENINRIKQTKPISA